MKVSGLEAKEGPNAKGPREPMAKVDESSSCSKVSRHQGAEVLMNTKVSAREGRAMTRCRRPKGAYDQGR